MGSIYNIVIMQSCSVTQINCALCTLHTALSELKNDIQLLSCPMAIIYITDNTRRCVIVMEHD